MSLKEDLLAVKALIGTEDSWTRNAMARTSEGRQCASTYVGACKWCLVGALYYVLEKQDNLRFYKVHDYLEDILRTRMPEMHAEYLTHLNDGKGFKAVHKLLDLAIGAAE